MEKNQPVKRVGAGAISASVFSNKTEKDGKEIEFKTVALQRSYTKDDGKTWEQEQMNLRANDIKKVQTVLEKVYEFLALKED